MKYELWLLSPRKASAAFFPPNSCIPAVPPFSLTGAQTAWSYANCSKVSCGTALLTWQTPRDLTDLTRRAGATCRRTNSLLQVELRCSLVYESPWLAGGRKWRTGKQYAQAGEGASGKMARTCFPGENLSRVSGQQTAGGRAGAGQHTLQAAVL